MKRILRSLLWGIGLITLQTTVLPFFSIEGVVPDLITIWIVFLSLEEGQIAGSVSGFISGLIIDFISGDFLGLGALAKTCCGFIGGYFYDEFKTGKILGTYRFFFAVLISSFIHSLIFFIVYFQGSDISFTRIIVQYGVGTTAYTSALCLIPMLRRK